MLLCTAARALVGPVIAARQIFACGRLRCISGGVVVIYERCAAPGCACVSVVGASCAYTCVCGVEMSYQDSCLRYSFLGALGINSPPQAVKHGICCCCATSRMSGSAYLSLALGCWLGLVSCTLLGVAWHGVSTPLLNCGMTSGQHRAARAQPQCDFVNGRKLQARRSWALRKQQETCQVLAGLCPPESAS